MALPSIFKIFPKAEYLILSRKSAGAADRGRTLSLSRGTKGYKAKMVISFSNFATDTLKLRLEVSCVLSECILDHRKYKFVQVQPENSTAFHTKGGIGNQRISLFSEKVSVRLRA